MWYENGKYRGSQHKCGVHDDGVDEEREELGVHAQCDRRRGVRHTVRPVLDLNRIKAGGQKFGAEISDEHGSLYGHHLSHLVLFLVRANQPRRRFAVAEIVALDFDVRAGVVAVRRGHCGDDRLLDDLQLLERSLLPVIALNILNILFCIAYLHLVFVA